MEEIVDLEEFKANQKKYGQEEWAYFGTLFHTKCEDCNADAPHYHLKSDNFYCPSCTFRLRD